MPNLNIMFLSSDTGQVFTMHELSYLKRRILLDFLDLSIRNANVISIVHHRNLIFLFNSLRSFL